MSCGPCSKQCRMEEQKHKTHQCCISLFSFCPRGSPRLRLQQNLFLLLSHICVSSLSVGYWLIKRRALHISVLSKSCTCHPSIRLSDVCFINIESLEDDLYDGKDLGIHENYFLLHLLLQVNLCVKNLLGQWR